MVNMEQVLERLVDARKYTGLSQTQAANLIGLAGASSLSDVETGRCKMTLERFIELCYVYNAEPVWVLTGINPKFDYAAALELAKKMNNASEQSSALLVELNKLIGGVS